MIIEQYRVWKDSEGKRFRPVTLDGTDLLNDRILNKGTAFLMEEREDFHLKGLLPPNIQTIEEQLDRVYEGFLNNDTSIAKYIFLRSLQDRNETLFYALVNSHIEEMAPIIYTPTVGEACEEFSHRYQKTRGLYITPANVEDMETMVHHFPSQDVRMIVVTDSQGILGIGDQGIGGIGIPIGKLSLYTLAAGIHPASCLPVVLDVGTNNEKLLTDPMYLGVKQKRIKGAEYDAFIEKFVKNVIRLFPRAILQWEDFSKSNAFNNLKTYRKKLPSFNDDIQGTGAVVLSGIICAVDRIKRETLSEQIFAILGAGAGGVGIADQICQGLVAEGLDPQAARERIFVLDSKGVVFAGRPGLDDYKKEYAKPDGLQQKWQTAEAGRASLGELLGNVPVTVLIGASGVANSFTQEHVASMLKATDRPVIFPVSNPTDHCEAKPEDLYKWSGGKAIVATGSPFDDVTFEGRTFRVGQGNNVFIFPGVGLAGILLRLKEITPEMFTTAAHALADCVSEDDQNAGAVFPKIGALSEVSIHVAAKIIHSMLKTLPGHPLHKEKNLQSWIAKQMWKPVYLPYRKV